jgi:hypothetical protein
MPDHFAGRAISLPQVLPTIDDVKLTKDMLEMRGGIDVAQPASNPLRGK